MMDRGFKIVSLLCFVGLSSVAGAQLKHSIEASGSVVVNGRMASTTACTRVTECQRPTAYGDICRRWVSTFTSRWVRRPRPRQSLET